MIPRLPGVALVLCMLALTAACGARRLALPSDAGTPLADADRIHAEVSAACRGVRTLVTVLSLSGRAGGDRLGGTIHAGFRRPAAMRLEGEAYGSPVFVLVSNGGDGTLWLPRDRRVLRGAPAADIMGALVGLPLGADDLRAVLTGCVVADPMPTGGRLHENGWASIDLQGGARVYLQRTDGAWRIRAARRDDLQIEYPEWIPGVRFPARVELRSEVPIRVELRASVSQLDVNTGVDDEAFRVDIPADAVPLSLEELRRAGPLREAGDS